MFLYLFLKFCSFLLHYFFDEYCPRGRIMAFPNSWNRIFGCGYLHYRKLNIEILSKLFSSNLMLQIH